MGSRSSKSSKWTPLIFALFGFVIGIALPLFQQEISFTSSFTDRLLEEEKEEEEENPVLEYAIVMVIVLVLILLTILFELVKEHAEESSSRHVKPIVESLFGELTVLGFLSIFTFVVTKTGWFMRLGLHLFGPDRQEELLEVFESVHYTIFFIMVFFVVQVLILVREAHDTMEVWLSYEKLVRHSDVSWTERAENFHLHSTHTTLLRWVYSHCCCQNDDFDRDTQQQVLLLYKALRDEFVLDRELDYPFSPAQDQVDADFNFGRYLGVCQSSFLQKVVHVNITTWVLFALAVVIYFFFVLMVRCNQTVVAWTWVVMAWLLCLYNVHFESHLIKVMAAFASKDIQHMAHQVATIDTNESTTLLESSTDTGDHLLPDWCRVDIEGYLENRPLFASCFVKGIPNRQQALYWMDRKGPPLYLFILQFDLLFVGIFSAVQFIEVGPYMYHEEHVWAFWLYVVLATLPILNIAVNKRRLVALLTCVCSLGFYRRPQVIASVIREEKLKQGIRTFIVVYKLRRFATQATPKQPQDDHHGSSSTRLHYSLVFDQHEINEVGRTFDEFDLDGGGSITIDEFEKLMARLGANLTQEQLQHMVDSLDTDKSGGVDKDEFIQWYADHAHDDDITEEEFAKFMFRAFDDNDSGELTIGEFKKKLDQVSNRFTVDEIGMLVNELDSNNGGTICEEEFEHLIRKYYPKELASAHHHH